MINANDTHQTRSQTLTAAHPSPTATLPLLMLATVMIAAIALWLHATFTVLLPLVVG
jgi:hypothetical protein